MFSGWFWRMGENEDWLDWYLWGVNVCQQHLARKPRNRGSCSLWIMNAYEWIIIPAVCYDKLEIQINIPNTSNPSTEVLLLLFVERNCLRIRPWDSSPFFLTFLGIYIYIYICHIFVILFIITEQANPRLCSLLHGQDSYVDSYFSTVNHQLAKWFKGICFMVLCPRS